MEASQSALVSSMLAIASLTNDRITLLINVLTGFSTLLLTVIAGTFGFSLWKQSELKKEAEKDVRKINSFAAKVTRLHATVQKNMDLIAEYVKAAEKLTSQISEKTSKLDPLIADVENKGKEVTKSVVKIKQIREDVERASQGLGTLSVSSPSLSAPASFGTLSDYLSDYTPSESASKSPFDDYFVPKAPDRR